jgi:hypothetical protein
VRGLDKAFWKKMRRSRFTSGWKFNKYIKKIKHISLLALQKSAFNKDKICTDEELAIKD